MLKNVQIQFSSLDVGRTKSVDDETGVVMTSSDCHVIVGLVAEVFRIGYGCNRAHFSSVVT